MRLSKCLMCMGMLTVISLVYIQLQVQIFDLAYRGKNKEQEIRRLVDANGNVLQNISHLKSANYLGVKLLTDDSKMRFSGRDNIVELKVSDKGLNDEQAANAPLKRQPRRT